MADESLVWCLALCCLYVGLTNPTIEDSPEQAATYEEQTPSQNNDPPKQHAASQELPSQPSFTMLSEQFEKALGKWKAIYVNAQWTTEQCEEIAFERTTENDRDKFKQIYENIEWEKVKLNFIQEGEVIAALLPKDIPGVFASIPVNAEAVIPEEEFSSFQYVLLGEDFMVVNDLNVDEVGYVLVLSRNLASVHEVREHLDLVGVNVFNVTGCVVPRSHDEL